jgi:hypothetical protein
LRNGVQNNSWTAICFSPGLQKFVATASTGTNKSMISADGINWQLATVTVSQDWRGSAANNNRIVVVGVTGTGNRVMWADDGLAWTQQTGIPADVNWTAVCWTGENFVAVASSGTIGQGSMWSPDGVTWTLAAASHNDTWQAVASNQRANPDNVTIATSNGPSSTRIMRSTDHGLTWTTQDDPLNLSWVGATWTGNQFVVCSNTGTNNRIMSSPDGLTWTTWDTPNDRSWLGIASNGNRVVTVANAGGTGNRAMATTPIPGKYLCRSWTRSQIGFDADELTATFDEVVDP